MENGLKRATSEEPEAIKKTKIVTAKVVQESDVGITQYINESYKAGGGFFGTIKQRYSDFQVNEIDRKGNVVHLTDEGVDLGRSKKERRIEQRLNDRADLHDKTPEEVEAIKKQKEEEETKKYDLSPENKAKLLELITAEELQQVEDLFTNEGKIETKTTFDDKTVRTQLHQLVRLAFQGKIETLTTPENAFKMSLAKGSTQRRNNNNHVDETGTVNYGLGAFKNYLHFTVYKENRETMEVALTITKFLRIPHRSVSYAGTKDRRGITCQRFCIHRGKVARVTALNKALRGAVLGLFAYENHSLDLGDLNGNEFVIAIRDAKSFSEAEDLESVVERSFKSLQEHGYINYYGLQRFGTFSISTHVLGIHLLKDVWKGAVELLLAEQDRVVPDLVEARRVWAETGNAAEALKLMPRRCSAEHNVLTALAKEKGEYSKNSYFQAIMQIPRNLRLIYVHAYQSYVWNLVASKRFEIFGLNVVEGDLVMVEAKRTAIVSEIVDGEEFREDVAVKEFDKVRPLTKEDIESGKYSIYDVVLPSPGYDVVYPTNPVLMEVYETSMAKDGLDPHSMTRKVKEFSLAGSYRAVMGRPTLLSYKIVKYNESTDPLIHTDLEILREQKERFADSDPNGEKSAVILQMTLGVSSYATMALREFMKADTSRASANFDVKV